MSGDRGGYPAALGLMRQRARLRRTSTLLVGLTGLASPLGGLLPSVLGELLELTGSLTPGSLLAGRVVLGQAGLLMVLTARLLARGSRAAWTVATTASAGVLVAEALREHAAAGPQRSAGRTWCRS